MVTVDHGLTKGIIFSPCHKTIDALGTANLYLTNVCRRFGLPDILISDRGPQFSAKLFQELGKALGIDHRMSTTYHPQTDGETKCVNQELETYLCLVRSNELTKWASLLPLAEFVAQPTLTRSSQDQPLQTDVWKRSSGVTPGYTQAGLPSRR